MNAPRNAEEAAEHLELVFDDVAGLRPKVTLLDRDEQGRVVVVVAYRGDELLAAVRIEAYVVGAGDSIRHRSQVRQGNTILVYNLEPKPPIPDRCGGYHLSTVKPPRVVPGPERHQWDRKIGRGQVAICLKCGCRKCCRKDYSVVFRLEDSLDILADRPACTGKPKPAAC